MSTNPDNAVGTNAAYGGRTSVNAFNDDLSAYTRGVLSGWACTPDSGLTVKLGGNGNTRDVAIAEDSAGNKTTINNRVNSPISVTIGAAPAANTRIDAIVAYVDASPQGSATITDNYEACGLITVPGSASASPVAPSESTIRSAITADGASGSAAYYVVLAYVSIASGTTDITANQITAGENAVIQARNIDLGALTIATKTTADISLAGTTNFVKIIKLTIPESGKYLISFSCRAFRDGGGATIYYVKIDKNNTDLLEQAFNWVVLGDTARSFVVSRTIENCNEGDTISCYFKNDTNSPSAAITNPAVLSAERIG